MLAPAVQTPAGAPHRAAMPAPPGARAEPEAEVTPRGPSDGGTDLDPDPWQLSERDGVPEECFAQGWRRNPDGGFTTPWGQTVISGFRLRPDGNFLASDGYTIIRLEPPKTSAADYLDTRDHAPAAAAAERRWGPQGSGDGDPFLLLATFAPEHHEN